MPSFQDSALIVVIALLLFGPKGMAKLARELGKLMGEFRRASADFRMQMDEEFRLSEQADQQKKIAAMEAAAPVAPVYQADIPEPDHPHMPQSEATVASLPESLPAAIPEHSIDARAETAEPLPIATSGDLHLMPPATGLPQGRSSSLGSVFESIPHVAAPPESTPAEPHEATHA